MKTESFFNWVKFMVVPRLNRILPNPSGQNQLVEHTFPIFFLTSLFLLIPCYGVYAALLVPAFSIFKELVVDKHYRDFFAKDYDNPYGGADGRVDLFYKILGSALAYGFYFLR